MIVIIKHYNSFNSRRYGDPWVAIVDADGKPDFSVNCGGYMGRRGRGEEGDLYVTDPAEGNIYMYGQKDMRGSNTELSYVQYVSGEMVDVTKSDVIYYFDSIKAAAKAKEESASSLTIKDIAHGIGKSVRSIALDLGIPLKTAEKWSAGSSEPPAYLLKLIEEHYNGRNKKMKIYKVYYEDRAEAKRNSASTFEEIIMEQNGNDGAYYTSEAEAMEAYKNISLAYDVAERFDRYGYFFSGKLIEVAEVDNDTFCEAVAAGEDLRYIYIDSCNAEIIDMAVSAEAE